MALVATCGCGKSFNAKPELAGKRLQCPACGQAIQVPMAAPSTQAGSAKAPQVAIPVTCQCGASFKAPSNLAGKQVACPNCRNSLAIPDPNAAPPSDGLLGGDPLGDLGDFGADPLTTPTPANSAAMPAYNATPMQPRAAAKKKSSGIPKAVIYSVLGVFGVIFLGCAGLFIAGFVTGVKQGIDNAAGNWKPHVSMNGGYAVMLPGRVRTEQGTATFGNFSSPKEDASAAANNGDEINITVCYDMPALGEGEKSWLEKFADIAMPDMKDATRETTTFAGQQAIKVEGMLEIDGQSAHELRWIFVGKDRVFDVSVLNGTSPPSEETVSKLTSTFRLMPGSAPGASAQAVHRPGDDVRKAMAGEWLTMDSDEHFQIDLPPGVSIAPPSRRNESLFAIEGRPDLVYYERTPRGKNYKFKVGYTRQLVQEPGEPDEEVLERFTNMLRGENNAVLQASVDSVQEFQFEESPGREVAFRWSVGSSRASSRIRMYLVDRRIFWIECITPQGQPFPAADFEKLYASFQPKVGA